LLMMFLSESYLVVARSYGGEIRPSKESAFGAAIRRSASSITDIDL
jgi:hypothetical protein